MHSDGQISVDGKRGNASESDKPRTFPDFDLTSTLFLK